MVARCWRSIKFSRDETIRLPNGRRGPRQEDDSLDDANSKDAHRQFGG
jgi:hypothetical protein